MSSDGSSDDAGVAEDIRSLARALLEDPIVGAILRDAGIERNFTSPEAGKVYALSAGHPLARRYRDDRLEDARAKDVNLHTAIAVARQVASGRSTDVNDEVSSKLIEENYIASGSSIPHSKYSRPLELNDAIFLIRELFKDAELSSDILIFLEVLERNCGNFLDEDVQKAWFPLEASARKVMFRYGFVQRPVIAAAARDIVSGSIDSNDEAILSEFLLKYSWITTAERSR